MQSSQEGRVGVEAKASQRRGTQPKLMLISTINCALIELLGIKYDRTSGVGLSGGGKVDQKCQSSSRCH